jgi:hypothetical protein
MILAKTGIVVPVKVSEAELSRALRILDALFEAAETAGYGLDWPKPYSSQITIAALDEKLKFSLTEATTRTEHKPTNEELAREKKDSWMVAPSTVERQAERPVKVHSGILRVVIRQNSGRL